MADEGEASEGPEKDSCFLKKRKRKRGEFFCFRRRTSRERKKKDHQNFFVLTVDLRADRARREAVSQFMNEDREHQEGPVGEEGPEVVLFDEESFWKQKVFVISSEKNSFARRRKNPKEKRKGKYNFSSSAPISFTCQGLLICPTMPRATTRRTSTFFGVLVIERRRESEKERKEGGEQVTFVDEVDNVFGFFFPGSQLKLTVHSDRNASDAPARKRASVQPRLSSSCHFSPDLDRTRPSLGGREDSNAFSIGAFFFRRRQTAKKSESTIISHSSSSFVDRRKN